ncbi:MAG: tetratricopeptide repeat protein [Flavobacteriales bacterium]|nr:tetratricopeptide repeat protein [Flavobacteriales bacterium]
MKTMKNTFLVLLAMFISLAAAAQSASRVEAEKYAREGKQYLDFGNWEQAIWSFTHAINTDPSFSAACINRGFIYENLGRFSEANQNYETALRLSPHAHVSSDTRAKLQILASDFKGAQVVLEGEESAENFDLIIDDYIALGEYEIALEELDRQLEANQATESGVRRKEAMIYLLSGDYKSALAQINLAIELDESPENLDVKGLLEYKMGNNAEALINLNKAVEMDPTYFMAHFHLFMVYHSMGQKEKAEESLNQSLEVGPQSGVLFFSKALLEKEKGNFFQALENYEKTSEILPEGTDANYNSAYTMKILGNYGEALYLIEDIINESGGDAMDWNLKGNLELFMGDYHEAINSYSRALELDPTYVKARYNRGIAYVLNFQSQFGCPDLQRAADEGVDQSIEIQKCLCGL